MASSWECDWKNCWAYIKNGEIQRSWEMTNRIDFIALCYQSFLEVLSCF